MERRPHFDRLYRTKPRLPTASGNSDVGCTIYVDPAAEVRTRRASEVDPLSDR
ncbi:hypothetical protein OAH18_02255 [bacterium]|nr:hypothetical protein [bacterium]